ncbi:MAG: hypothetical protein BWX87_02718 [Bacteroidetes bacterium ADurb.Bin123]|nr:MAG: hypothetical protein BWX87_02718 [Bacteroidetes bacterium ADurb.Bin123]
MLPEEKADLLFERKFRIQKGAEAGEHPGCHLFKDGVEQPVFGAKVVMEKRFVDARLVGNLLHAGAIHSPLQEYLGGRIKDPFFRELFNFCHGLNSWFNYWD